jgi:hypothetical protein
VLSFLAAPRKLPSIATQTKVSSVLNSIMDGAADNKCGLSIIIKNPY